MYTNSIFDDMKDCHCAVISPSTAVCRLCRTHESRVSLLGPTSVTLYQIYAVCQISQTVGAKTIVTFTLRGSTARRASKMRPLVPVMALCPFKETARQLVMSWGVYPDLPSTGSYG